MIEASVAYGFDDLLLVPKYSTVESRKNVDISVNLPKGYKVLSPLVPANMKSIVGYELARKCLYNGSLVLLHRFAPSNEILSLYKKLDHKDLVGVSVGIQKEDFSNIQYYYDGGVRIFCVDVANCSNQHALYMVKYIATRFPDCLLIAGNVCDREGTLELYRAGADIVKVGIGNGLSCRTQTKTGVGIPQLSAVEECAEAAYDFSYFDKNKREVAIISDGGIRAEGDVVKALCFADLVMMGAAFATTQEAAHNGVFSGSSTHREINHEGVHIEIGKICSVDDLYNTYNEGLRSGCSYVGAHNLVELQGKQRWVQITK